MNTQVGKSVGIALLLAAGLLAALFAMGVFAPAGVGAAVKGTPSHALDTTSGSETITVTFQVDDTVDGMVNGNQIIDDVIISVPGSLLDSVSSPAATVTQDGSAVGMLTLTGDATDGLKVTITKAPSGGSNLVANKDTTVVITGVAFPTDAGEKSGVLTIEQRPSTEGIYTNLNENEIFDNAEADLVGNNLVVKFKARRDHTVGYEVVITPDPMHFAGTVDIATTAPASTPADTTTNTIALAGTAANNAITVVGYDKGATITITIGGLTVTNQALTDGKPELVKIAEGMHHMVDLEVGADPVRGPGVAETKPEDGAAMGADEAKILSSTNADTAVRVMVKATAASDIRGGTDIVVSLPGFQVPDSIDRDDVVIDGHPTDTDAAAPDRDGSYYGPPQSVEVSGSTISLRLPVREILGTTSRLVEIEQTSGNTGTAAEDTANTADGKYTITFFKDAGIKTPKARGDVKVTVSDTDDQGQSSVSPDAAGTVTIAPHVTLKPKAVSRGDAVKLTAKGLLSSGTTATVHLDEAGKSDADDLVLGRGLVSDNMVSLDIDTNTSKFKAGVNELTDTKGVTGLNTIFVVDGSGHTDLPEGERRIQTTLTILPTVKLDVSQVKRSGLMEVSVSDWYYGNIQNVTVGGLGVMLPDGDDSGSEDDPWTVQEVAGGTSESGGKKTFKVIVPRSARLGEQQVTITGTTTDRKGAKGDTAADNVTKNINVGTFSLSVNPDTAVTGQTIRIEGAGFGERTCITSVMVGEQPITEATNGDDVGPGDDCVKTDSNGELSGSFKVPGKLAAGTYTLEVRDANNRVGDADLTIPKPMIELTPTSSQRGDTVTVVGSNFPAEDLLTITYSGDTVTVATTDTRGNWRATFEVPVDATIGREHDVVAQSEKKADGQEGRVSLNAKAMHRVPDETLMISPAEVPSGGRLTVTAGNLPLFTPVSITIGGIGAAGRVIGEDDASDGSGRYEKVLLVPQLTPGSHIVELTVHTVGTDVVVAKFVDILDIVTRPTAEVFEDLIADNQLTVVWRYDNATATWASYDPTAPAELNDLNLVSTDDIVWVQLTASAEFQGRNLNAGWSLITLE